MSWVSLRVRASAAERRDAVVRALFDAGSLGVQEDGDWSVTAFPAEAPLDGVRAAVLRADPAAEMRAERAPDVDWSEAWRQQLHLHQLGALTVSPPWLAEGLDPAATIVIEPGMAFGTGEHPTTRGVVRLIQGVVRPGDRVADLGAGSAVLAIAAAKLGAASVAAIELDPDAIGDAEENVRRNGVAGRVQVICGDAALLLPLVAPVRVVLANIISSVITQLRLPAVALALEPGGRLIVAGILREERPQMEGVLRAGGWRVVAEDSEEHVVERDGRSVVATFFAERVPGAGDEAELGEDAAHHVRVRRLAAGTPVAVTDGRGRRAAGALSAVTKSRAAVIVAQAWEVPPPPAVHLLAPVGDRDRMLWLAEKSVELGIASWRSVMWRRSTSVTPRGSGDAFAAKLRARMVAALEQSGGAWLPELRPERRGEELLSSAADGELRLLLDPAGAPVLGGTLRSPVTIALGPEGGLEPAERGALVDAGFTPVSLGGNILRFETAGVAAIAVVQAALAALAA